MIQAVIQATLAKLVWPQERKSYSVSHAPCYRGNALNPNGATYSVENDGCENDPATAHLWRRTEHMAGIQGWSDSGKYKCAGCGKPVYEGALIITTCNYWFE